MIKNSLLLFTALLTIGTCAMDTTSDVQSTATEYLFHAISTDNLNLARYALAHGADLKAQGVLGQRPLDLAVMIGQLNLVELFTADGDAPSKTTQALALSIEKSMHWFSTEARKIYLLITQLVLSKAD